VKRQVGGPSGTATDAIEVVPATAERWAEVADLLPRAGGYPCWCQLWRRPASEFATTDREQRRDALRAAMDEPPAPGILALVGADPVGWIGFGPRPEMDHAATLDGRPADDAAVWSVACLAIRPDHRNATVAAALVDGLVAYAREENARMLEAYPIDLDTEEAAPADWYAGLVETFVRAGFRAIGTISGSGPTRMFMRLDLEAGD
jgi:GNAT superfamily N-acetyltransferase